MSFRKCHILKPEKSSPNGDSNPHFSIGERLRKQTCQPLHHASHKTKRESQCSFQKDNRKLCPHILFACVCVCVCVCVCAYVRAHVRLYVYKHVYVCACFCVCACLWSVDMNSMCFQCGVYCEFNVLSVWCLCLSI